MIINPYTFAAASSDNPGTTDLVAWWDLTEASGTITTIADDNSTANDLTTTGSPSGGTTGKWGTTVNWNGSSQYARSTDADFDITGALTVGAWIYLDTSTDERILSKYTASGNQRGFMMDVNSNKARFYVSSNGSTLAVATGATNVGTGGWAFVVGVYVPSTSVRVYLNGTQDAVNTTSIPASIFNSSADLILAASDNGGAGFFDGMIQSAFVYSRALTAGNVDYLYNGGAGRQRADL